MRLKRTNTLIFYKLSSKNVLSSATGAFRSINDARPR